MQSFLWILVVASWSFNTAFSAEKVRDQITGSQNASQQRVEKSTGAAKNRAGEIVYIENHRSRFLGEELVHLKTEYFDKNSRKIGFISTDYQNNQRVPDYEFHDLRSDRRVQVSSRSNTVDVAIQLGPSKKKKGQSYKLLDNMVAGQGLHRYLQDNVEKFIENSKHREVIRFLIPLNEDYYNFRIKKHSDDERNITLRIEADSWLFRLVAPHIDVTYEKKTKRLLKYQGPSNLLDENGEKIAVVIDYSYSSGNGEEK